MFSAKSQCFRQNLQCFRQNTELEAGTIFTGLYGILSIVSAPSTSEGFTNVGMENYSYTPKDYIVDGASWEDIREGKELSKFDKRLCQKWDDLMAGGLFRYNLDHVKARIISGPERFIAELNLKRGIQRRCPERIESLNMPFNPDKFNFTKVKPGEVMFQLTPQDELHRPQLSNGSINTTSTSSNAVENGNNGVEVHKNGHVSEGRHLMLINVSPLGYGHALVVCDVDAQIHQKMSLKAHKMAIETMLLSNHPGFRAGFNSLCALASVNHQHFHTWYMEEPLTIESAPTKLVCHGLYEMTEKPTRALVLQLHGHTVDEIARMAFTITDFYQKNNVAHNVFLTRGSTIGGKPGDRTVRIYIWPRKSVVGIKDESGGTVFNVAVAELAGFLPMYSEEDYQHITEEEIIAIIQNYLLPNDQFDSLRNQVMALLQEERCQ